MSLETSASENEEKDVNECMFAGKMCLTDCGVENCALMVLILLMKNVAKSLVVRVDKGVGRTKEQRKCFKEHVRVRRIVNFVMIVCHFSSGDIVGSEDETIADSQEGESERRLRRKMACGGVCVVSGTMLRLRMRRK